MSIFNGFRVGNLRKLAKHLIGLAEASGHSDIGQYCEKDSLRSETSEKPSALFYGPEAGIPLLTSETGLHADPAYWDWDSYARRCFFKHTDLGSFSDYEWCFNWDGEDTSRLGAGLRILLAIDKKVPKFFIHRRQFDSWLMIKGGNPVAGGPITPFQEDLRKAAEPGTKEELDILRGQVLSFGAMPEYCRTLQARYIKTLGTKLGKVRKVPDLMKIANLKKLAEHLESEVPDIGKSLINHGIDAGIPMIDAETVGLSDPNLWDWDSYVERCFIPSNSKKGGAWCFSDNWASLDSSVSGAVARLRYLADKKVPTYFDNILDFWSLSFQAEEAMGVDRIESSLRIPLERYFSDTACTSD